MADTQPTADFAISKFKSNLAQGGARPSLFQVELIYPAHPKLTLPKIHS